jgi:hypothetical protein
MSSVEVRKVSVYRKVQVGFTITDGGVPLWSVDIALGEPEPDGSIVGNGSTLWDAADTAARNAIAYDQGRLAPDGQIIDR